MCHCKKRIGSEMRATFTVFSHPTYINETTIMADGKTATAFSLFSYRGMSLLYLKNHTNAENMMIPQTPVIMRTHLNASGSSNIAISKFMPNIPATTPKMATTNVAVVSSSSNWISWFRTLSCKAKFVHKFQKSDAIPQICTIQRIQQEHQK